MEIEVEIYGYKRGHYDSYLITLNSKMLIFKNTINLKKATCQYISENKVQWLNEVSTSTLEHILNNENIIMPSILPRLLEVAFLEWKNNKFNSDDIKIEIEEIIKYLNYKSKIDESKRT